MSEEAAVSMNNGGNDRLLDALQRLLAIRTTELHAALDEAADSVASVLGAEKVDAFLLDEVGTVLVAVGVSDTPLGRLQRHLGLDRVPLAGGGRTGEVFATGNTYMHGHVDQDLEELPGVRHGLGVRSSIAVPLLINGERRGVLQATSTEQERFSTEDLRFLVAVSHWLGMIADHAMLVGRLADEAAERARQMTAQELITVLAHDLNNHLTPLQGRVDLLRLRADREGRVRDHQDADAAMQAVRRLQRLVADLLDASRLEGGVLSLSLRPVDLVALARSTAEILRGTEADIRVQAPDELVVEADPERVRQALENLLANAIRYSPAGAPVVVATEARTTDKGTWAAVEVRDRGPGIPPELMPRLFTRFGAGPQSTGLGLGLYLAHAIAEAHGGTLSAQSTPGNGATFSLALPLVAEAQGPLRQDAREPGTG